MMPESDDVLWMAEAIKEAAKGVGKTAPNPPVGAVIVRDGMCIGKGWHRAAGQPHAEREAIADALATHGASSLRGATLYVTLEPCSTHGRTPPCTHGIIEAGIQRVVYACLDENPSHQGRADGLLTSAGIEVHHGVLADQAIIHLRPFFKVRHTGLPWVIWKSAMSIDGRITRHPNESQWLTSAAARRDVQSIRAEVDAIITSGETVRRDRPALNLRIPELMNGRAQPRVAIFTDHPETLPADAPLFEDPGRVHILPRNHPADSLRQLVKQQGILSAMVEAGGRFSAALAEAGLIDEVVIYLAPMLTGGPVPALGDPALPWPLSLHHITFHRIDHSDDVRLRALVHSR